MTPFFYCGGRTLKSRPFFILIGFEHEFAVMDLSILYYPGYPITHPPGEAFNPMPTPNIGTGHMTIASYDPVFIDMNAHLVLTRNKGFPIVGS